MGQFLAHVALHGGNGTLELSNGFVHLVLVPLVNDDFFLHDLVLHGLGLDTLPGAGQTGLGERSWKRESYSTYRQVLQ